MSYFEKTKLTDNLGNPINPVQDESITLLRRIFQLLKPLGIITGGQSNRLNIDVSTVSVINNMTNLGTCSTVTSVNQFAGIPAFDLLKAMSRTGYNTGIRAKIV